MLLRATYAAAVPDSMHRFGNHGDKISFHQYGNQFTSLCECPDGGEAFEIFPVATILNFQRQFVACENFQGNSSFGGALHGMVPEAVENDKIGAVHSVLPFSLDVDIPLLGIPLLNDSQSSAANKFLTSTAKEIQIIQG